MRWCLGTTSGWQQYDAWYPRRIRVMYLIRTVPVHTPPAWKFSGRASGKSNNTAKSAVVSGENCIWPLMWTRIKLSAPPVDLSLNNVTDAEAFPGLIRQTHRKIRSAGRTGQVAEALVMAHALSKMTKTGMPESVRIAWEPDQPQRRSPRVWVNH